MTPYLQDPDVTVYVGDALSVLRELPAASIHCCVTSPPYFGLRDYGEEGQLGLEESPTEYVSALVNVFREVRRVLTPHGTLWLNLGDSYATQAGKGSNVPQTKHPNSSYPASAPHRSRSFDGLKPKDLMGMPWRVAFALQEDGWFLRSDIIWEKPNAMPESVNDRPTKSHEYVFLLAKGEWKTRIVQISDLTGERIHLSNHISPEHPHARAHEICIRLASAILDCAKLQYDFCLPSFDPQERQQLRDSLSCDSIASIPMHHRAALWAHLLLSADSSPKEFMQELDSLGITLTDAGDLLIGGVMPVPLPPSIDRYGETSIAIHDSGKISEFDLGAHHFKFSAPSRCSYYFDKEAVLEPYESTVGAGNSKRKFGSDVGVPGGHEGDLGRGIPWKIAPEPPQQETLGDLPPEAPRGPDGRRKTVVKGTDGSIQHRDGERWPGAGRNIRSVWSIVTQPYPGAHYAVFPEELARRCILAGCPERVCTVCGEPQRQIVRRRSSWEARRDAGATRGNLAGEGKVGAGTQRGVHGQGVSHDLDAGEITSVTLTDCGHNSYGPGVVLDPFLGSGTTALVARNHRRRAIGIELNKNYVDTHVSVRLAQQSLFSDAQEEVGQGV